MRVKLGDRIYFCTLATHTPNSTLIFITTSNGVYTVKMPSTDSAYICHRQLLVKGYFDFSGYTYTN